MLALLGAIGCVEAPPAAAGLKSVVCGAANADSKVAGKACDVLTNPGKAVKAGKDFLTGHFGSAVKTLAGSASTASTALGLAAIGAWVAAGAEYSLGLTNKLLGQYTTPQLRTTWFSSRYWRIAGIAALLTLPFLFAAAVQALFHSDLSLLARAAIGYLPLAMLAIAVAAPLTMLLLAATDQLSAGLSAAAGGPHASWTQGVSGALIVAPFLKFLIALVTTACALVLWLELAIREAAVYVIVLMLPLGFAALVWPARRIWAIRAVELLVALILAKLAIVAVFDLGGSALEQLGHDGGGLIAGLAGTVLVLLAALSPWAVLRLVPLSELASSAVGSLRADAHAALQRTGGKERLLQGPADDSPAVVGTPTADVGTRAAHAEVERLEEQSAAQNGSRAAMASREDVDRGVGDQVERGPAAPEAPAAGAQAGIAAPEAQAAEADPPRKGFEGWHPMFQAEDFSWKPLTLGLEGIDEKLWPPDDPATQDVPRENAPAEDHEPLPPPQEGGSL